MCKFHCAARYTISLHYSVINISTNKLCITYVDLRFNWVSFRANICLSLEQHRKSELMLKLMLEIDKIKLLGSGWLNSIRLLTHYFSENHCKIINPTTSIFPRYSLPFRCSN
jgi:hypothetical protein